MGRSTIGILALVALIQGCSTFSLTDALCPTPPPPVECEAPSPLLLPPIDEDGLVTLDREHRKELIHYFIMSEECFEQF